MASISLPRSLSLRDGKAEDVRFAIQITERRTTLHANGTIGRIHVDRAHCREVDHQTVIAERAAANVMAAAPDRREQVICPSEIDRRDDVSHA